MERGRERESLRSAAVLSCPPSVPLSCPVLRQCRSPVPGAGGRPVPAAGLYTWSAGQPLRPGTRTLPVDAAGDRGRPETCRFRTRGRDTAQTMARDTVRDVENQHTCHKARQTLIKRGGGSSKGHARPDSFLSSGSVPGLGMRYGSYRQ